MSIVFYDHLVSFEKLEKLLKRGIELQEEREEIWGLIDELIHHSVFECILDNLEDGEHEDFVAILTEQPHNKDVIDYLQDRLEDDVEMLISQTLEKLHEELFQEFS